MEYKILKNQIFTINEYKIVPIRFKDRMAIMKWRNEQIFHLRQAQILTEEAQDNYFKNVVQKLFNNEQPNQILFSFLKNDECVGYGGLVHINWIDKNAEISFLINTSLENDYFGEFWKMYLSLIEKVAFDELNLFKIYTYAFDVRQHLYPAIESAGFKLDAVLTEHCFIDGRFHDVKIHSKFNRRIDLKEASKEDLELTYKWVNNSDIRKHSFNKNYVSFENHQKWFLEKINSKQVKYFIITYNEENVGSIRVDFKDKKGVISYLIDPNFHGKGLGYISLNALEDKLREQGSSLTLEGEVFSSNLASIKIFEKCGYNKISLNDNVIRFSKDI